MASAGPLEDFESGIGVELEYLAVTADGQSHTSRGFRLDKASGSLDLTMTLSDFGVASSQTVLAQGTANGNIVEWSINTTFNPPVELDTSVDLQNVTGVVRIEVTPLQGLLGFICAVTKCARTVQYSLAPGSWLTVSGEGPLGTDWSEPVSLDDIRGFGGAPLPDVRRFVMDNDAVGEESENKSVAMTFQLDRTAPKGGAEIELISSNPQEFSVPATVVIPEGKWFHTFYADLLPGSDSFVRVEAQTSYGAQAEYIRVRPYQKPGNKFKLPILVLPKWLSGCIACLEVFSFDEAWSGLATIDDRAVYFTQSELVDIADHLGVESASLVGGSISGWLTGTTSVDGESQEAFLTHVAAPEQTHWLGDGFSPSGVTDQGLVFGTASDAEGSFAALYDGVEATPLPVEAAWSTVTAVSRMGAAAGVAGFEREQFAFTLLGEEPMYFELAGPGLSVTDINDRGEAVANVIDEDGASSAYVLTESGDAVPIEVDGFSQVHATAINSMGWVVGLASDEDVTTGFLWLPTGDVTDLTLASPITELAVLEAIDINDDGEILAKTIRDGEEQFNVLVF